LRFSHCIIGVALLATTPASAAPLAVQPGLWEATVEAQGGNSTLQQLLQSQLARLKPDQQAKVENLISVAAGAPLTRRVCVTPALLQRDLAGVGGHGTCSRSVLGSSPTALELQVSCSGHEQVDGTLRLTVENPKTVTGMLDARLTTKDGTSIAVHRTLQSHWLAADCGAVKTID
jgi:hypothetical protein